MLHASPSYPITAAHPSLLLRPGTDIILLTTCPALSVLASLHLSVVCSLSFYYLELLQCYRLACLSPALPQPSSRSPRSSVAQRLAEWRGHSGAGQAGATIDRSPSRRGGQPSNEDMAWRAKPVRPPAGPPHSVVASRVGGVEELRREHSAEQKR